MSKIELDSIAGGFNLNVINENFQKIEDVINGKVLFRDNPVGEVNQMLQGLDMNGFPIYNVPNLGGGSGGSNQASDITFTPTGSISSNNVQSAIVEVASDVPIPAINFPLANQFAAQIGTSQRYAREDHVHPGTGGGGGGEGTPGTSAGVVYAYKRSVGLPLDNPGDVTYNFAVATIVIPSGDALANGWTKLIPEGPNPLYVAVASASSTETTDNIAGSEWATPVRLAENGANGINGLNTATIYIYQRNTSNTAPALPSATATYVFNTSTLTGLNNGWETSIPPPGGEFLFVSTATAASLSSTDTIGSSEWAAASLMARNGLQGPVGPSGSGYPGQRGSITVYQGGYSSWSDSAANSAVASTGLGGPYNRDIVTLYGSGFSQTRFYDGGSWIMLTAVIDGNLLVTGTVSASKVSGGILSGIQMRIGSGSTPSGNTFEITSSGTLWSDSFFGRSIYVQGYSTSTPGINGVTYTNTAGIQGTVDGSNSSSGTGGVYGRNFYNGTSGLIAPGVAYDFYANGSGTNYGPFTGAHDALVNKADTVEIGDILVDVRCVCHGTGVSNTIFETARSSSANQKAPIGIVAVPALPMTTPPAAFTIGYGDQWVPIIDPSYEDAVVTFNRTAVNAVGEGMINVVGEGGNIQAGDLIVTSNTVGKGMKQLDDIVRSTTVAKARESATFVGGEIKQIACIYLCG